MFHWGGVPRPVVALSMASTIRQDTHSAAGMTRCRYKNTLMGVFQAVSWTTCRRVENTDRRQSKGMRGRCLKTRQRWQERQ